jgi:hypothetical protein
MPKHDSWAGVNGQMTTGRRLCSWTASQDCLELHKLTVFATDMAKRQRFYIQQVVRKPHRATVQQHILQMRVLNDHVRHLPTLKDSHKALPNKHLKLDKPIGTIYMSTGSRPIKVVDTAPRNTMRADKIANATANIGKVTAVVAVMSIFC